MKRARIVPTAALALACMQHSEVAREFCDGAARRQGNADEPTPQLYAAWLPSVSQREAMWSQVLETSVGQPPDDIYGTAPPSGGPVCFVRADWLDAAVVYVAQDGASVLQPFNFQDGSWRIDYGAAHVIWQAE